MPPISGHLRIQMNKNWRCRRAENVATYVSLGCAIMGKAIILFIIEDKIVLFTQSILPLHVKHLIVLVFSKFFTGYSKFLML